MSTGEKWPAWLCNAQEMGSECNPPRLLPFHTQLARERRESVQPGMPEPDDTLREGGLWVAVRIVFLWVWKRQVVFDQRISLLQLLMG